MKTRKTNFSNVLGLFIFLLVIILNAQTELSQSKHYNLQKLADGVYAAIHNDDGGYAICNAGIVDLGDKTIVIDPFISPTAARDLKKHAELLTGKPVSLVLNLDPHSDHTRGNQVFVPEADIIGTANARRFIAREFHKGVEYEKEVSPKQLLKIQKQLETASEDEKIELKMWYGYHKAKVESFPELVMTPPNITIIDTMTIYGSERNIVINFKTKPPGSFTLALYNIQGKCIHHISEKEVNGKNRITLNTASISCGSYICRMKTADGISACKKVMIMR